MAPSSTAGDDDLDEVLGLEPRSGSRRKGRSYRTTDVHRSEPVRPWRGGEDESWEDVIDDAAKKPRRTKPPVFWRARDSLYFEPLVALAIIVVLLVSMYAYTQNWPPVYVVESNSMQHGPGDHLGDINAGDIVLAQKAPVSTVVTYVEAIGSGYSTYGSLGDVLVYYPNGSTSATPIIHRAIIYLEFNPNGSYNATGLSGLPCGHGGGGNWVYYVSGSPNACGTVGLSFADTLYLYNIGGRTIDLDFSTYWFDLGSHSGFLTLGDNNSFADQLTPGGGAALSSLVEPGWVIGVARGMIPWFGALKLLLDGNSGKVPTASWEYMGLTIGGAIFAAAGLHILFKRQRRAHREERERHRKGATEDDDEEVPPRRAGAGGLRGWKARADAPAEKERPGTKPAARAPARMSYEQRRRSHFVSSREGRPRRGQDRDTDDDER